MTQELSRHGIGGSQAAAVCGMHPYSSPIDVWCEIKGEGEPFEGNEATYWGLAKEGAIRQRYFIDHRVDIRIPDESIFSPDHPWMRATPDGIVFDPGSLKPEETYGLEIKTANSRVAHRWGESSSDIYPIEYRIQCLWYMHVTGLNRWDIAVLIDSADYREYRIDRTPEVQAEIDAIVAKVTEFWETHIVGDVAPPPDATDGYARHLARQHPRATGEAVQSTPDVDSAIADLRRYKVTMKATEAKIAQVENEIKAHIGNADGVISDEGRITWREQQGRVSHRAVAEELAAMYADDMSLPNPLATMLEQSRGKPTRVMRTPRSWGKK